MHSGSISATENAEVDDRLLMFCHIKYVGFINNNYAPTLRDAKMTKLTMKYLHSCPELKEIK